MRWQGGTADARALNPAVKKTLSRKKKIAPQKNSEAKRYSLTK
jgi:hypothetical protein